MEDIKKEIIESIHPYLEAIKITPSKENIEIKTSLFKSIINPMEQRKDINNLHSQINYSNQILHTMAQQLDKIENYVSHPRDVKDYKLDPTHPIYHYHTPSTKKLKGMSLGRDLNHKIDELVKKLKALNVGSSSGEINTLSYEEEFDNMVSKLRGKSLKPKTRNYYPRPSFADVQFEERSRFIENKYSGDSIVEWIIDGAYEHQVLDTIQNMTMADTAFKL